MGRLMRAVCFLSEAVSVLILVACLSSIEARSTPQHALGPATPVPADQKILSMAREWFFRFQTGHIDRSQLDSKTNAQLTDAMIDHEAAILRRLGQPTQFIYLGTEQAGVLTGYVFAIRFDAGRVIEHIAFDSEGKIAGIDFQTFIPAR